MKPEDWDAGFGRSIGMFLNGNGIRGMDTRGQRVVDDSFLLLFNAHDEGMDWILPPEEFAPAWRLVIDTSGVPDLPETIAGGSSVAVASKGMVVLQALASAMQEPTTRARRRGGADHRTRAGSDAGRIRRAPIPEPSPTSRWSADAGSGAGAAGGRDRSAAPSTPEQPAPAPAEPGDRAQAGRPRTPAEEEVTLPGWPTCASPAPPTGCRSPRTWDLQDAAALVPYLQALGVDWVYLSPVLAAEPGSAHGYDVVDHAQGRRQPRR